MSEGLRSAVDDDQRRAEIGSDPTAQEAAVVQLILEDVAVAGWNVRPVSVAGVAAAGAQ